MSGSHSSGRKIAVVGSGAVGCYYGTLLARAGNSVHFLMRRDFAHVQAHGLEVRSQAGSFKLTPTHAHESTESIGPCDLVIIALKATDNRALLNLLPPLIHKQTLLLTLQNGLGNEAFLASHFGPDHVLGGLCFVCLNRTAPGVVEHYSQGRIALGEHERAPMARTRELIGLFQDAEIDCRLMEDLGLARWRKLVWNVPFNGLAIIGGGVDVSQILQSESLSLLARALMTEIIGIANALGYEIPLSYIEDQFAATNPMGPYKPSSLLDFLAQRPVEVEAIWGEAFRQGQAVGCQTPRLEMLYHLLKKLCL